MYFVPALLLSYYTFDLKLYSSLEDYGLQKMQMVFIYLVRWGSDENGGMKPWFRQESTNVA